MSQQVIIFDTTLRDGELECERKTANCAGP